VVLGVQVITLLNRLFRKPEQAGKIRICNSSH
jgi:hypothetical protein